MQTTDTSDPYCLETAACGEILDFETSEGVEREQIPRALSMTRDEWIAATAGNYWSEIPLWERQRLAGRLWDRVQRLAAKSAEMRR